MRPCVTSTTSKTDTEALSGAFFFVLGQMGPFCLGFSADSQNPSIFPQSDQIHIKKRYPQNVYHFSPHLVFFHSFTPSPVPILAL
jgi:hypothetical protein